MKTNEPGMTMIVKTITRLTVGLILIYGIFVVLKGHNSPGGGFAGGVIITLSFIHLMLAFGKDAVLKKLSQKKGLILASFGGLIYLIVLSAGLLGGYRFPVIVKDIASSLLVGTGLFVIFLSLVFLVGLMKESQAKS